MSRELNYLRNPWVTRAGWAGVYLALAVVCILVFSLTIGRIKTHQLPVGGIDLTTKYSQYLVGEPISFTLNNHFNTPIYVLNKCPYEPLGIYRLENNNWVRLHDTTTKTCNDQDRQVAVPADKSVTMSLAQWPHLFDKPGSYRLVFFVEYYNALPYKDIQIIAAPATLATNGAAGQTQSINQSVGIPIVASAGTSSLSTHGTSAVAPTPSLPSPSLSPTPSPSPAPSPASNPTTWTENLSLSGGTATYATTSFTIKVGDTLKLVYLAPRTQEIITNFRAATGSPAVSSVTVDSEFTTRSKTFTAAGTYTLKAQDQPSNSVTLVVK